MKIKSSIATYYLLIFCFLTISFSNKIFGQEYNVYELTDNSETSKQNIKSSSREEFYNFSQNLHPTFYFQKNKLKTKYGKDFPVKLTFEDVSSFNSINKDDKQYSKVRLITITLDKESDLSTVINLDNIKSFSKLNYVFIKCNFECDPSKLKKFINSSNKKIRIFYTSVKQS